MKKTLYIIAFAAMSFAAAVSCQKESFKAEDEPQISAEGLVFYASLEGAEGTRTTMNYDEFEGYKVEWEAGDSISVNGVIYEATPYKANRASAIFTKKRSGDADPVAPFEAYYPASLYDSLTKTATLPATQYFNADSSLAQVLPMRAYNETENVLKFKNLCGLLELNVNGSDKVQYITVIDSTKALSGKFTVTDDAAVLDAEAQGGVTLYCGDAGVQLGKEDRTFYIAVPAGDYDKLAIKFETRGRYKVCDMTAAGSAKVVRNGVHLWRDMTPGFKGDYFYFEAVEPWAEVKMDTQGEAPDVSLKYSYDGKEWDDFVVGQTTLFLVGTGDKLYFKANNPNTCFMKETGFNYFVISDAKVNVGGNIMFLLDGDDPSEAKLGAYCFGYFLAGMSGNDKLISASDLKLPAETSLCCYCSMFDSCKNLTEAPALPATELADRCYMSMFYGCKSLTEAPALPAKTLAEGCYSSMFSNCSNLTKAPELPAETMAANCYYYMFSQCESLTEAPELPAETMAVGCYKYMFSWTGLVKAPELPAVKLAESCYSGMFDGCNSLVEAPELPATELAKLCYEEMFMNCDNLIEVPYLPAAKLVDSCYYLMFTNDKNLKKVKCLATNTDAKDCTKNWLQNVSDAGTFVKAATMTGWSRDDYGSGIPVAWTAKSAYIDASGTYYGDGITVAGYEWAPVNCGYDEKHPYGLLYQWGRHDGGGYSGEEGTQKEVYDWVGHNGREEKSDEFYAKYSYSSKSAEYFLKDWLYTQNDGRWGSTKTQYDPCPDGWRVPTYDEMNALIAHRSGFVVNYEGKNGWWFSGSNDYSENVPRLFLPCAGDREYQNGAYSRFFGRTFYGAYWTVTPNSRNSYYLYMHQTGNKTHMDTGGRANANSVRCVNMIQPAEQLKSGQEAQSNGYNSTDYNW